MWMVGLWPATSGLYHLLLVSKYSLRPKASIKKVDGQCFGRKQDLSELSFLYLHLPLWELIIISNLRGEFLCFLSSGCVTISGPMKPGWMSVGRL